MAKQIAQSTRVYYAGYDLGTATRQWSIELAVDALDPTSINDAGERVLAGARKDKFTWAGLFDSSLSAEAIGSALVGGTPNILTVTLGSGTAAVAFIGSALQIASKPAAKIGELVDLTAAYAIDGSYTKGRSFGQATSIGTGSFSGTMDQNGMDGISATGNTSGFSLVVQFISAELGSGTGIGSLRIQHCNDGTGWANVAGTMLLSGAPTALILTSTATLNRFVMLLSTGTAGSLTFNAVLVRNIP